MEGYQGQYELILKDYGKKQVHFYTIWYKKIMTLHSWKMFIFQNQNTDCMWLYQSSGMPKKKKAVLELYIYIYI